MNASRLWRVVDLIHLLHLLKLKGQFQVGAGLRLLRALRCKFLSGVLSLGRRGNVLKSNFSRRSGGKVKLVPLKSREKKQVEKVSAQASGYMELEGAKKDGDCAIVEVKNGISKELGCCNLFDPKRGVKLFSCGTCTYEE